MKNLAISLFAFFAIISVGFGQQQQQVQVIKPTIAISEIIFAIQLLDNIELRGSEVDALIEVKSVMVPPVIKAQNDKKNVSETLTLEFKISTAQNLLGFLQRAKMTGADAERYRKFVEVVVSSAQPKK